MESWQWTCIILCGFGVFKEFRPSEPFLIPFLLEYKDSSVTQYSIVHQAFPAYTYTYLATVILVFLLTDYLRYRVVIIFEGICYVITWVLLIWGQNLISVVFVEIFYGIVSSTEIAYYSYIYSQVDREQYAKVTSYCYSALFAGRFLGGISSQLLVYFKLMDYLELNYFSLASVSTALAISLFLPKVKRSIYFHRDERESENSGDPGDSQNSLTSSSPSPENLQSFHKLTFQEQLENTKRYMLADFKSAYGNSYVLKWSIWWACATAGHLIVTNFIQALWEVIVTENGTGSQDYNGAVEATHTLISTILAFGVGHIKIKWSAWGEPLLSVSALVQCGSLIWMARTDSLYIAYGCYIIFRILFQVIITVATSEVAQKISDDSFGLIFGINTFIALTLQTILTLVVADEVGLAMKERDQFLIYGVCFGVLGIAFLFVSMCTFLLNLFGSGSSENTSIAEINDIDE